MSTENFVVLDSEEPGLDPFANGKAMTRRLTDVNSIARSLGIKQFEYSAFQDLCDIEGPELEPEWFDAVEGKNG